MKKAYASFYNIQGDPAWTVNNSSFTKYNWYHQSETNGLVVTSLDNSDFTITIPGIYFVSYAVSMTVGDTLDSFVLSLFKNGERYVPIGVNPNVNQDEGVWAVGSISGIVRCAAGDRLDIRGKSNTGTETLNMAEGSMTVFLLSKD